MSFLLLIYILQIHICVKKFWVFLLPFRNKQYLRSSFYTGQAVLCINSLFSGDSSSTLTIWSRRKIRIPLYPNKSDKNCTSIFVGLYKKFFKVWHRVVKIFSVLLVLQICKTISCKWRKEEVTWEVFSLRNLLNSSGLTTACSENLCLLAKRKCDFQGHHEGQNTDKHVEDFQQL